MMAGIKGKNTKPELLVRSLLHRLGYRFRLHRKDLPGRPDIVLPKHRAVILVHGCFWHGHDNCPLYRLPKSRQHFWAAKIEQNKARDAANLERLLASGWRVAELWECAVKGRTALVTDRLVAQLTTFLGGNLRHWEIRG